MHRFVMLVAAASAVLGCSAAMSAAAESKPYEFPVRYAVVLDNAETISGEVTCKSNRVCELLDHKKPELRLVLRGQSPVRYISASCSPNCLLWPEHPIITPQETPQLMKLDLSVGENPSPSAVLLTRHRVGAIFIAY
jgi:hypothetical protein